MLIVQYVTVKLGHLLHK